MNTTTDILRLARESAGLSLSQAVQLTDINQERLELLESNAERPNTDECARLSNTYQVSYYFLRTGNPDSITDILAKWHNAPGWLKSEALIKYLQLEARG